MTSCLPIHSILASDAIDQRQTISIALSTSSFQAAQGSLSQVLHPF